MTHSPGGRSPRRLPVFTRRQFDQGLGWLASSLVAACHDFTPACPADSALGDPLDGYEPRFLSRGECFTVAAAAEVLVGPCPPGLSPIGIAKRADSLLARIDAPAARQAKQAVGLLEITTGFSKKELDERRRLLSHLIQTRGLPRDVMRVLKLLTVGPYYSDPEVRKAIGYLPFEERPRVIQSPVSTVRFIHAEPEEFG